MITKFSDNKIPNDAPRPAGSAALRSRPLVVRVLLAGFVVVGLGCMGSGAEEVAVAEVDPLEKISAAAQSDPQVHDALQSLLKHAERLGKGNILWRPGSLEELRNPGERRRLHMDSRIGRVERDDPVKAEIFSMAMSDSSVAAQLFTELPFLAAAYRLTGDPLYLNYLVKQLEEVVQWDPLQRPGWTLYTAENNLPGDGRDGVWLATGLSLTGIVQTLQILGPDTLPPALQRRVDALLEREIAYVVEDWNVSRPWYVRRNVPHSNQWIVPSAGLVAAAAYLGRDRHAEAYELGVANLLASLNALGDEGAPPEGINYASIMELVYIAARLAEERGDPRLITHPFLKNFPDWLVQMFLPGGSVVNHSDSGNSGRGSFDRLRFWIATIAVQSGNPHLVWLLRSQPDPLPPTYHGILALGLDAADSGEPPLTADMRIGRAVVWRSGWSNKDSAMWVRGGHELDLHGHHDRGHVSFIVDGLPVLMETGTPTYGDRRFGDFKSVLGHNVLQVGDNRRPDIAPADLRVVRMDETGGEVVVVDAGDGYPEVETWERTITWDRNQMTIRDSVKLHAPDTIRFRWHLGTEQSLEITENSPTEWNASVEPGYITRRNPGRSLPTPAVRLAIQANIPIVCSGERGLNHTLEHGNRSHEHTVVVVESAQPTDEFSLTTVVKSGSASADSGGEASSSQGSIVFRPGARTSAESNP